MQRGFSQRPAAWRLTAPRCGVQPRGSATRLGRGALRRAGSSVRCTTKYLGWCCQRASRTEGNVLQEELEKEQPRQAGVAPRNPSDEGEDDQDQDGEQDCC